MARLSIAAAALALFVGAASGSAGGRAAIVYVMTGPSSPELAVLTPAGSVSRLTRDGFHQGLPAWSPGRARIAFVDARRGDADIRVTNVDGTGTRVLAGGARRGSDELYPAWSPDGRLIAFSSYREGSEHVYVMRQDGTGLRRLTRTPAGVSNTQPRFSADGRFVLFASTRGGSMPELYRVRLSDGGGAVRLTRGGALMPDVSPDGSRIAFVSSRDGASAIWIADASGGHVRRVARAPGRELAYPRFSPDGRTLVYTTFKAGETVTDFRLRTVRADGTGDAPLGPGAEADW